MRIRWLGTAGFEIEAGNSTVLLDPFLSRPPNARPRSPIALPDIARADQIFLSHGHFDHAMDVPALVARTSARVYAPSPVCEMLLARGVAPGRLRPLKGVETIGLTDYRVRSIPSRHVKFDVPYAVRAFGRAWSAIPSLLRLGRWPMGEAMGFLFTSPEGSWSFLGSAGHYPERISDLRPDIALVPVQGHSDIARLAAELVRLQQPRWVIPHHHDDFYPSVSQFIDLDPFISLVGTQAPETRVVVPEIGQWLRFERGVLELAPAGRGAS